MQPAMKNGTTQGVYYDITDLAGIGRRLLILLIDSIALVFLFLMLLLVTVFVDVDSIFEMYWIFCLGITYLYLAVLPVTSLGTVGYIATGVRLVNLHGQKASIWQSTFRFGLVVFGPLNILGDIIWLGGDPNRQSIRDKFAKTYVVRRNAVPTGSAPIRYKTYYMFNYNLMFAEVERPQIRT